MTKKYLVQTSNYRTVQEKALLSTGLLLSMSPHLQIAASKEIILLLLFTCDHYGVNTSVVTLYYQSPKSTEQNTPIKSQNINNRAN